MHRCSRLHLTILLIVLLSGLWIPDAGAQILRLGSPRPPALDEDTYAASIARDLQEEIEALLQKPADSNTAEGVVRTAQLNLRLLMSELLKRGDLAGPDGSIAIVTSLTLASARAEIDDSLAKIMVLDRAGNTAAPTLERFRAARGALARFNRTMPDYLAAMTGVSALELDSDLPVILAALRFAVANIEQTEPASHWVIHADSASTPPLTLEALRESLRTLFTTEEARTAVEETIEYLERGERLPDFEPLVDQYRAHLEKLLHYGEEAQQAEWLPNDQRSAHETVLNTCMIQFRDPTARTDAINTIDRLASITALLSPLNSLSQPGPNRLDPRSARTLLAIGESILGPDGTGQQGELWPRLLAILDRMRAFRSEETSAISRELRGEMRNVAGRLQRAYLEAEAALITQLGSMSLNPGVIADPAFISLITNHQRALDDLLRLRRLPEWIEMAGRFNSQAATAIEGHLRQHAENVLNPARRQAAVSTLTAFEDQARLFGTLPFEKDLRDDTEIANALTNGRAVELLRRSQELRSQWTTMWARGESTGPVVAELTQLRRLLLTMSDVGALRVIGGSGSSRLNRWSAWEVPVDILGDSANDLTNRLRFATEAILTNNRDELLRQLDRLDDELPLPALVGRLDMIMGDRVESLPSGVVGAIGQVAFAPDRDSLHLVERPTLAEICRYALEAQYAERGNRAPLAGSIREYLNFIADELLDRLDQAVPPVPSRG